MDLFAAYNRDRCTRCGECFHRCPVMRLPIRRAINEMERLRAGRDTRDVLQRCQSCFACNLDCPEQANPTQLVLQRWYEAYQRDGYPVRGAFYVPHAEHNFRSYAVARLPKDEQAMVRRWAERTPAPEILYPGCNWITAPYLAKSSVLDGVTIRGSLAACCGEMYYRMGLYDQVHQSAQRLIAYLHGMKVERLITPCTACLNLMTNILPSFGYELGVEVEHMLPWMLRRMDRGEIKPRRKLSLTATVQESCSGKLFGHGFMDYPRELLDRLGVRVREQRLHRDHAACCGIASGFSINSAYHPKDTIRSTLRALSLAQRTGADAIATYCAGCLQMLPLGQLVKPWARQPIYHVMELLQMALGEPTISQRERRRRAATVLGGVTRNQGPAVLSRRCEPIPPFGAKIP